MSEAGSGSRLTVRAVSDREMLLSVSGAMTGDNVLHFEKALHSAAASSYELVTLDLTEVTEVSSWFVGVILELKDRLSAKNRGVRICGYNDTVWTILHLLKVDQVLEMQRDPP